VLDAPKDVLLRLGAEPREAPEPPFVYGVGQLLDGGDVQLPVQHHCLLRPERGDGHELADAGRDLRSEVLHDLDCPRREELQDLLSRGPSDVRDALEALQVERGDVGVMPTDRSGGFLVGPDPERIPSGDREEVRVLVQKCLDDLVRPGHTRDSMR
jgi:hypothetical protein